MENNVLGCFLELAVQVSLAALVGSAGILELVGLEFWSVSACFRFFSDSVSSAAELLFSQTPWEFFPQTPLEVEPPAESCNQFKQISASLDIYNTDRSL